RIAVFARGDERILTWNLLLDDEAAAERYLKALAGAEPPTETDRVCQARPLIGELFAARSGRRVVVLAGPRAPQKPLSNGCARGQAWARRVRSPCRRPAREQRPQWWRSLGERRAAFERRSSLRDGRQAAFVTRDVRSPLRKACTRALKSRSTGALSSSPPKRTPK